MNENRNPTQSQWDDRYKMQEFAYGVHPNDFLKSVASHLRPNSCILSLAEGEGRNAVFLASLGHDVTGVDISPVGLGKAQALADKSKVSIKTVVADLASYDIDENSWGAIVSIWCHTPPEVRKRLHRACVAGLK